MRKDKFDLVLLDIWMPQMNGLELLAHMRAEELRPKAVVDELIYNEAHNNEVVFVKYLD